MEAGEIRQSRSASPPADYDPSHEWPGEVLNDTVEDVVASSRPLCRLLVLRTSVLPAKGLVITDGYPEVQFGRDAAPSEDVPRVRMKEMEVSKPQSSTTAARLSPPRVASVPRRLHHLDTLAIGSTTFLVHIHPEPTPCSDCCSTFENEIPLFQSHKRKASKVTNSTAGYLPATSRDPKKALTMLKQRLLTSSAPGSIRGEGASYTDRSARRRSLYPASRLDAPGVTPPLRAESLASTSQPPPPPAPSWDPPPSVTTSQPPTPLPTTNIGHRLLLAQGWTLGSSLGVSEESEEGRIRLTAPLEVASTSQRAGIGMKTPPTATSAGWREDGRQRRWGEIT
ncbi:hypothetical protein DFH06DRAFT_1218977 [Mycena polygramma]|nr:hypothetical protein DFH06DRAFT_1218977 [Mycena polygramma]